MNIDKIYEYKENIEKDLIDIFTQIIKGREFEESYLKDKIKW